MNSYYLNLPKKRVGAGALIFNEKGELLIVKPTYKDHWSIPGGSVEENESPKKACMREVKEEVGLQLKDIKFLCVEYTRATEEVNECLQFIFYGGTVKERIQVDGKEIGEYRFVSPVEAIQLFGGEKRNLARRLPACLEALKNDTSIYLENGY